MNFLIGCCEKQPIRKLGKRLRSYEKENRSLIPAGDKVPAIPAVENERLICVFENISKCIEDVQVRGKFVDFFSFRKSAASLLL